MKVSELLLDLLYPPKCVFCGTLLADCETDVCRKCRAALPEVDAPIKRGAYFRRCYALYYYEELVADSVRRYKFGGMQQYSRAYGRLLAMRLLREHVSFDVLTWVPISKRRRKKRGYDQAHLLAKETAKQLGVPCVPTLMKLRDNPPQSRSKDASERRGNVRGVYKAYRPDTFSDKRVLLIDDVITTGSTLSEAAAVLRMAGAASVECAVLAATRPPEDRKKA